MDLVCVGMECSVGLIFWTCEAASDTRSYIVESLAQTSSGFELRIYDTPGFDRYQETVLMQIQPAPSQRELFSTGTLKSGEFIQVTAFIAGGVTFQVEDDRGYAIGRCVRNVTTN